MAHRPGDQAWSMWARPSTMDTAQGAGRLVLCREPVHSPDQAPCNPYVLEPAFRAGPAGCPIQNPHCASPCAERAAGLVPHAMCSICQPHSGALYTAQGACYMLHPSRLALHAACVEHSLGTDPEQLWTVCTVCSTCGSWCRSHTASNTNPRVGLGCAASGVELYQLCTLNTAQGTNTGCNTGKQHRACIICSALHD